MNLMDKIYRALEAGTKCNQLYRKESLVLLMQKESIPMHMLSGGESQAMMAEAGLSNITVPDFQVVTDKDFISLPIVYGQAIKQILQYDLRENEKQQDMTIQGLEEACLQLMTEYAEERFEHAMKIMPDGSRFYPVKLHPADWKDNLESGFSNIDRMQSSQMYMPKSYQMEDGTTVNGTLQQAFYYLYGEYVKEKKNWADMQNRERARLEEKYPGTGDEVYNQRQEAFLNWYQTVAESYLLDIQVKRGKVLSIFSPNDMKIIEGVLDSGSGAEVEEAREQVENAKKFDPDGGYVYPVTFQPEDWFESLDSNMGYIDLLQSSDAYALQYSNLNLKRKAILRKITTFEQKNKNQELTNAVAALKKAQDNMESAEADLNDKFADNANICLSGVLELLPETEEDNDPNAERNNNNLTAMFHQLNVKKLLKPGVLSDINDAYKASYAATSAYVRASQEVADAARILMEAKSQDYTPELKESYQQLENINEEMEQIKETLRGDSD